MTRIVGDLHLRKEEPFRSACISTLNTVSEGLAKKDTLIFLGDFFHTSRPYPEELKIANDFFHSCPAHIVILAGNHEYLKTRDTFVEDAFSDEVEFIQEPTVKNDCCVFLPWLPEERLEGLTLKEFYEAYLSEVDLDPDNPRGIYVLYHFEDEKVFSGLDELGVDLSILEKRFPKRKMVRIGGHIHNSSFSHEGGGYAGTPYVTRKDENERTESFYLQSEGDDYNWPAIHKVVVPELIEYRTFFFEELEDFKPDKKMSYILSVIDVPSTDVLFDWKKKFDNVFIEDYSLKFGGDRVILQNDSAIPQSIREFLELFIKQNKIDKDTANYLLSVF